MVEHDDRMLHGISASPGIAIGRAHVVDRRRIKTPKRHIDDDQIEIEIADDVRIRQMRQMVTDVRAKGEPVKDEATAG